jgi:hypothetical protein
MILKTQTLSYTTFIALTLIVISGCLIIFFSSIGQPGGKNNLSWKKYVDQKHGFSVEVPASWQDKLGFIYPEDETDIQKRFTLRFETIENCTSSSSGEYIKTEILPYPYIKIRPLGNQLLNGFVVAYYHLDNITPGPEAMVFNCPYLIRLGMDTAVLKDADTLLSHIISSMKVWSPGKDSQL